MTIEAYCMKCRTMRTITDAQEHMNARGTRMAQGPCPVCGTNVTTFLPKAAATAQAAATPASGTPAAKAAPASPPATNGKATRTGKAAPAVAGSTKRGSKKSG